MSVVTPDQLHVNAVSKTPKSVDELARAQSELEDPLSKAFTNTKLTTDQKAFVLDLCARNRPVLPCQCQSLVVVPTLKQHFLCPLTPVLSIVRRTEPTLELKLSLINASMVCLNGTSSKNVLARGVARVLLPQRRSEALVSALIIAIPSTVILST